MSASWTLFLTSEYATSCGGRGRGCCGADRRRRRSLSTDLEGERRDALPHAKGSPQRPPGVLLAHLGGEVGNTAGDKEDEGWTSCPEA